MPTVNPALLLLADARFPSGAHAHSFGVEAAHGVGDIVDLDSLHHYVLGRLRNIGTVEAAFAAATTARTLEAQVDWAALDLELSARTMSPALLRASRTLGRQLLRAVRQVWPHPALDSLRAAAGAGGPLQPIALGAAGAAAGLTPYETALCSLHHLVGGTTTAAVRLLGLDPFAVAARAASLTAELEHIATRCAERAGQPLDTLPAVSSPLADVLAEHHATWEVRLFAS